MISTNLDIMKVMDSSLSTLTIKSHCPSDVAMVTAAQDKNYKLHGVVAGNDIPEFAMVKLNSSDLTIGRDLIASIDRHVKTKCLKVFWKNEQLETNSHYKISSCLSFIRSARDRHEQNVELVHQEGGYFIRTLRPIRRGEQLLIWYEEGYAREVGVPILSLVNIQGHQNYMCAACKVTFTHPNILKAHLLFQCSSAIPDSSASSLVPFQLLLQTISKKPESTSGAQRKSKTTTSASHLQWYWGQRDIEKDLSYRSAFRTYSTSSCNTPKGHEDAGLMTPDSSTDQSSALNLSVRHIGRLQSDTSNPWDMIDPQHIMPQVLALPLDCQTLAGCYQFPSHLHSLDFHIFSRQAALHGAHTFQALMDSSTGGRGERVLPSSQTDQFQDCSINSHSSPVSPNIRNFRSNNPYGFTLHSDKEPLDQLPQAYCADKSKKKYLCLCCGKLYSRKYGLKIHMRTHNGYKPLKCKICSRPFGDPSNLNKHERLHAQGESKYRCEHCGKVLVRRRDLERHVRSRHPMESVDTEEVISQSSPDSSPMSIDPASPNELLRSNQH